MSVIIPTLGRPGLADVLEGLDAQVDMKAGSIEVIVVVDGKGLTPAPLLDERPRSFQLRVLEIARSGAAAARDVGWRTTQAPIVFFLDDDVVPSPRLVAEHLDAQKEHGPCVVLGRVQAPPGRRQPWAAYNDRVMSKKLTRLERDEVPSGIHYGGNVSLPRQLLIEVGGHDHMQQDADVELGDRIRARGAAFRYHPAALGVHHGSADYATWRRRCFLHGRWDVALRRDRGLSGGLDGLLGCFHDRHPLNRLALRLSLGRRSPSEGGLADAAARVGSLAYALRLDAVSYAAFSYAANLLYWSGVRDAMRGSAAFWRAVRAVRHHRGRPYMVKQ